MPPTPADPMPVEQSAVLTEFARACKTAARSVSLYPATHPAIEASLSRVTVAAARLAPAGEVTLTVHAGLVVIDGRAPARPDPAIGDLAALLHRRMVGALRFERGADAHDWHALLRLLARAPEELIAEGGIGKAWAKMGRDHFHIREIDYAEVLRERDGAAAQWDDVIAQCLRGALDDAALTALLETLGDPSRFGDLIDRLQTSSLEDATSVAQRIAILLEVVKKMLEATAQWPRATGEEAVLQTVADAAARLTPDMLLALVGHARVQEGEHSHVAGAIVDRMRDGTIASFVARSVISTRGASERLALAFEALVPEGDRKERLLDLAKEEAERSPLGEESGFEELWHSAANMLTSYTDETYVSAEYARELTSSKTQAVDVERVSDDPPERIDAWLRTVSDDALGHLDLQLLLDLVQVENDPGPWTDISRLVVSEIERRTERGLIQDAQRLANAVVIETATGGREALRTAAEGALQGLARGPFVRNLVAHLQRADDADIEVASRLAHTVGPRIIEPLTEVLVGEDNPRSIRRLRELLFGFGATGRQSVEQLKRSENPAIRRTAIDLLRMFGGREALADLASMLEDADPQVQRDAIRAIVQIGSDEAYAVLQRVLIAGGSVSATIRQQLIGLRDERAVPLFCYVINHSQPRGHLVDVHARLIEALGTLSPHAEATATLRAALYRGEWWAPHRTAVLRKAAAAALGRLGTPEALAILNEAARAGGWGVRKAARMYVRGTPRGEGQRT
jgi:hypothetical protein